MLISSQDSIRYVPFEELGIIRNDKPYGVHIYKVLDKQLFFLAVIKYGITFKVLN